MQLHILSDLHLDCAPMQVKPTDADAVILAGDIGTGIDGVRWAKAHVDLPVIYVPGNHEYYDSALDMDEWLALMRREAEGSNVHLLDRDALVIDDVRFIGTTLWTDLLEKPFAGIGCGVIGSDAAHIRTNGGECLADATAQALFERNKAWLQAQLAQPFDGKTVVITHHAPSAGSLHPQYAGNPWNSCFITDMESLMGDDVALWVHGHTHNCFDYKLHGTRVICNPRGYPGAFGGWENSAFNPELVINV